jgi:predicted enzyme related to lactoylglutathione lyase
MSEHGTVWWTELNTHHPEKARKFWTEVMGWKAHVTAMGDMSRPPKPGEPSYTTFMNGEKPAGGCFHMEGEMFKHVPDHWFTYFQVNDVDASSKVVVAAGGKVVRPAWDIPGVGRIAVVQDVNGCTFGLGKPAMQMPAAAPAKAPAKAKKAKG